MGMLSTWPLEPGDNQHRSPGRVPRAIGVVASFEAVIPDVHTPYYSYKGIL